MIALIGAHARAFLRDRPGLVMTLALPPLVYLLFAALFGAGARGEVDLRLAVHDAARAGWSRDVETALGQSFGARMVSHPDAASVEAEVLSGRADVGVLLGAPGASRPVQVLTTPGRALAGDMVTRALESRAPGARPPTVVQSRTIGPAGDLLALYYAGAVAVMFLVFNAMHGAMGVIDDRRSGLTARLRLLAGGTAPIIGARLAWLTLLGVAQSIFVFAAAVPAIPAATPGLVGAWAVTAALSSAAAAGVALALIALCRSRAQAQPVSTSLVLLMAALGGSMAPRFLMPDEFRAIGWLTPHAWTIEAYQAIVWRGQIDAGVLTAWVVLAAVAVAGGLLGWVVEARRTLP
jgi:ABC-2 type transport system permease protein